MIGGGPFGFAPGEWTDDTSMAIAVARVTATGMDAAHCNRPGRGRRRVRRLVRLPPQGHRQPDPGGTVPRESDRRGNAGHRSDLPGRKGGNGSLMRTAAIGAGLSRRRPCLRAGGDAVSRLTHDDARRTGLPALVVRQSGTPC